MSSRTSQRDDILLEKLEEAFFEESAQERQHSIARIVCEHNPIDLAFAVPHLPAAARPNVYEHLPDIDAKIQFIINVDKYSRTVILREVVDKELKELIEKMPPDEAVTIVESLSFPRFWRILDYLEPQVSSRIRELQQHGMNTAGRLMTNEFFSFPMETPLGRVAVIIREKPSIDLTRRVFVVDDEGRLRGYVPSRNLIINSPQTQLRQVMQAVDHSVEPEASREEVIDLVNRYKIPALPVVTEDNVLVGVVTYEDVVEAMEEAADDTLAYIAGTSEDLGEYDPLFKRFLLRAPWLLVTLLAGLTSATVMLSLQDRPWFFIVPFFAPLINALSGNVGIQSSTVLVRSMATGTLSEGTKGDAILQEIALGAFIGMSFGVLCGFIVYLLNHLGITATGFEPYVVGITVSLGMSCACIVSTLFAVTAPFAFSRIGVDPAVASGPVVTSFNDVLSTCMYIIVAKVCSSIF